jgi:hypothetical protein
MSTQIYITPIIPEDNCKVDHTKVATLASSFNTSVAPDNDDTWAFIGGTYSWMSNPTTYYTAALGGNILNVPKALPAMAIILPVDVDVNDVITLQGIARGTAAGGANCQFLIGVSYVSCLEFTNAVDEQVNVFTLIPAQLFPEIPKPEFNVCFSLETTDVTLSAGTLLYVGVTCPTFYNPPADCNFSYTLDITKSCAPIPVITNVRIQNCCEQAVFEVISLGTQNLPASGTFSDTEGNCWTIIETTSDPIDTVRFVDTSYNDCAACLIVNPCPMNLVVESCCSGQSESFTGSLPGISLGDTFIDTYGFCWNVTAETSGPITGLVIVDSITTDCPTCITTPGACPDVYNLKSCCGVRVNLFTTLDLLGSGVIGGDTFMDQYGYCWTISPTPQPGFTVNAAFIQAVTNYGAGVAACQTCLADLDSCKGPVIYKVQNCCSGIIEYVSYTFGLDVDAVISISTIVTPTELTCYTVLEWDDTSTPTITIDTFNGIYENCEDCGSCPNFYIAYDCLTDFPAVFYDVIPEILPIGGYSFVTNDGNCWYSNGEITSGPATITIGAPTKNCGDCLLKGFYTAVACDGVSPNEVIFVADTQVGLVTGGNNGNCYTITTPTLGPATIFASGVYTSACGTCIP